MPETDHVTGAEFGRWVESEEAFRARLEARLAETARVLGSGLAAIGTHLAVLNGKTGTNTNGIASLEQRLIRIEREYEHVATAVDGIKTHGCTQYQAHRQVLNDLNVSTWSPKKKAAVGGGMIATGALMWPALHEIAKAMQALIGWGATP